MENQPAGNPLDAFLKIMEESKKQEVHLQNTVVYPIIDTLAEKYLSQKSKALIEAAGINKSEQLTKKHSKDIIDIYFFESKKVPQTLISDARIEIIEFIGVEFDEDGFTYIKKHAFKNCSEQLYALKLLILYAAAGVQKDTTIESVKNNFENFDARIRGFVSELFKSLLPEIDLNKSYETNEPDEKSGNLFSRIFKIFKK